MARLVAVLRRPEMMTALTVHRQFPFSDSRERDHGGGPSPYRAELSALQATPDAICPWRERDLKAWTSLSRVPSLSARAAQAIVRALIGSVVDPRYEIGAAPPELELGRGSVDLRPHLCHPDGEVALLRRLESALPRNTDLPNWHFERRDELARLPAAFRGYFLWGLALSSWTHLELTLAAFAELGLAEDEGLRVAVALLFSRSKRDVGLWWCDVLTEVQAGHRLHAAELVIEGGGLDQTPSDECRDALIAADWQRAIRAF